MTPSPACCEQGITAGADESRPVLVLGAGFAGLAAAHALAAAGRAVVVLESGPIAGGLSRTERFGDFLFDLGGHRFFTHDAEVADLIGGLLGEELIDVPRSSKIFLRGRFFDYPLRPRNAVASLGVGTSARVLADYALERIRGLVVDPPIISLEDWVVRRFGRTLFEIYFREYSEKVWGLPCDRISAEWVAKRIQGLSLGTAIRNAFTRAHRREVPSLIDRFFYPRRGIGRIAERFAEALGPRGRVLCSTRVTGLRHEAGRLCEVRCETAAGPQTYEAEEVVSTIPLTTLAGVLDPPPPPAVRRAAAALGYRDLVLVAVAVNRPSLTDQTWIYLPERTVPFGRIHEPKNWSREMAPADRTLVVAEFFCQAGDAVWNTPDDRLAATTVAGLAGLGFLLHSEVSGTRVLRVPHAYPRFEVGYDGEAAVLRRWCAGLGNLDLAGRTGSFEYFNMDHAIRSGLDAAARVLAGDRPR